MGNPRFHLIANIERNKHRRLMAQPSEPRDAEGPAGTYGCACPSRDAHACGLITMPTGRSDCKCLYHRWPGKD